jgi:hypothetical protein
MVQIHLKQSKTDQLGKGADIVLGRTDQYSAPRHVLPIFAKIVF